MRPGAADRDGAGSLSDGERKQYLLRIDPDLWAEVEKWAADELRSVNAQVEYILRDAVGADGRAGPTRRAGTRRRGERRRGDGEKGGGEGGIAPPRERPGAVTGARGPRRT